MQMMVRERPDLARSMDSSKPMQMLDIDSLTDSACADATDAGETGLGLTTARNIAENHGGTLMLNNDP